MFAITRPSTSFGRLNRVMDDMLAGDSLVGTWLPPVDVVEDKDTVRVSVELPGMRPEDVKIMLENNVLTIRGEKQQLSRAEGQRVQLYERVYGSFERSFAVPNTVDADRIGATCEHGVLTVTLPKAEKAKPRAIEIAVSQGANR